jgi:Transposase, Mutator family
MNRAWHKLHPMPRNPTLDERIAWHCMHQEHCACRPVPETLVRLMTKLTKCSGLDKARKRRPLLQTRAQADSEGTRCRPMLSAAEPESARASCVHWSSRRYYWPDGCRCGSATLTYYAYPSTHWRQIRTNNPLERIIREIRQGTRVVGAFPDWNSALMLVAAGLRRIASTKLGKRRYLAWSGS